MLIGYARVSTHDQSLDLQLDALTKAGCEKTFTDTSSGKSQGRPGFDQLYPALRKGDLLVVWRLDRLGRSLKHLVELIAELESSGVGFMSISEAIDTTTPGGKLVFHVFAALAEFERDLLVERTKAGLDAARARGRVGGRKRKLSEQQQQLAVQLYQQEQHSLADICSMFGVSKPTLYAYIKDRTDSQRLDLAKV